MATAREPVPSAYQALIPYFAVADAAAFLDFVGAAFGAAPSEVMRAADGTVHHAEARIRDCVLMIGQTAQPRTNMLYLYVPDVDAAYARAMATPGAGRSLRTPTTEWYGDRSAGFEDRWGNQWWLATHVEDLTPAELEVRARQAR